MRIWPDSRHFLPVFRLCFACVACVSPVCRLCVLCFGIKRDFGVIIQDFYRRKWESEAHLFRGLEQFRAILPVFRLCGRCIACVACVSPVCHVFWNRTGFLCHYSGLLSRENWRSDRINLADLSMFGPFSLCIAFVACVSPLFRMRGERFG